MEKEIIQTDIGYIKLYKNTRGYNWEIKLHEGKENEQFKQLIAQIEELNNIMLTKFDMEE